MVIMADLHIHTALSPCAGREMLPQRIVRTAVQRGLSMIAICDHNTTANVRPVTEAAAGEVVKRLKVIPGIEITTREEVHVLGLFPALKSALAVGGRVLETLPDLHSGWDRRAEIPPAAHGCAADVSAVTEKLLAAASTFSLSEAVGLVRAQGGLAIAAHVDRRAFSVIGQLGVFPEDPRFDAAEISAGGVARGLCEKLRQHGLPLISSSDSHFPEDIGSSFTTFKVEELSFAELVLALKGTGGRSFTIG